MYNDRSLYDIQNVILQECVGKDLEKAFDYLQRHCFHDEGNYFILDEKYFASISSGIIYKRFKNKKEVLVAGYIDWDMWSWGSDKLLLALYHIFDAVSPGMSIFPYFDNKGRLALVVES